MDSNSATTTDGANSTRSLVGAATVLFTLLLLIIGGGVALYARLSDPETDMNGPGNPTVDPSEGDPSDDDSAEDRPLRDGRRLTRTRVGQLKTEKIQLESEHAVMADRLRNAIFPEDRAVITARLKQIESRLAEIERTLRDDR